MIDSNRSSRNRQSPKEDGSKKGNVKVDISDDNFMSIDTMGIYEPCSKSPDGLYAVACRDSEKKGQGAFVLVQEGQLIYNGEAEHPNDGKVADNGNFIINHSKFGAKSNGTFTARDYEGRVIIEKHFDANLFNNGLSDDGEYAVTQTANNKESDDGNKLCFYDLAIGQEIWSIQPPSGWASDYEFDTEHKILFLCYSIYQNAKIPYTFDGKFIGQEQWKKALLEHGDALDIYNFAKEEYLACKNELTPALGKEIFAMLKIAKKRESANDRMKATIYSLVGEVYDKLGVKVKAVKYYEKAIGFNPDVDVKERCEILKKELEVN